MQLFTPKSMSSVLDYMIAEYRGDEILKAIRVLLPTIPIVMFSASLNEPGVATSLWAAGATALVPKPDALGLFQEVENALTRAR